MSSIPLYKAFIEVGASEDSATKAAEDVIQVSQLEKLATKTDMPTLKLAYQMDGWLFGCIRHHHRHAGIVIQIMLSPGVTP